MCFLLYLTQELRVLWNKPPSIFCVSVCLFISLFIYPEFFSEISRLNFLNFWLNLGFHLTRKVTELNFLKKILFGVFRAKVPKMRFFRFYEKFILWLFLLFCIKLQQRKIVKFVLWGLRGKKTQKWAQNDVVLMKLYDKLKHDMFSYRLKICLLFKFDEVSIKITPPIIKIDYGTKFFGKSFVPQLISCFKVIRAFSNNWLNESYLHRGSNVMFY